MASPLISATCHSSRCRSICWGTFPLCNRGISSRDHRRTRRPWRCCTRRGLRCCTWEGTRQGSRRRERAECSGKRRSCTRRCSSPADRHLQNSQQEDEQPESFSISEASALTLQLHLHESPNLIKTGWQGRDGEVAKPRPPRVALVERRVAEQLCRRKRQEVSHE